MEKESNACNKYIVGVWRDDPAKVKQAYSFRSWAEALEFCMRNRESFALQYHVIF